MTPDIFGYLALVFGLVAMGMKNLVPLRIIHSLSALAYIIYGFIIDAFPLIIGGSLFMVIHFYHLFKVYKKV